MADRADRIAAPLSRDFPAVAWRSVRSVGQFPIALLLPGTADLAGKATVAIRLGQPFGAGVWHDP